MLWLIGIERNHVVTASLFPDPRNPGTAPARVAPLAGVPASPASMRKTRGVDAPEVDYVRSGDVNVAYTVVGEGPLDLVLVGGWVVSNLEWAWEGPAA